MKISPEIIKKHWEKAALEEASKPYLEKGYKIFFEKKVGDFVADLVAEKEGDFIVFEVMSGGQDEKKKDQVRKLTDYVNKQNGKLKLVFSNPPKEKNINIDHLMEIISDYVQNNTFSEIDSLSTHSSIEEIEDVEIEDVTISESGVEVKGAGWAVVRLQNGSDSDLKNDFGAVIPDSYPFQFYLVLTNELKLKEFVEFHFDTSSFHE